eukprot:2280235-Amphidinium_carterae.1
MGSTSSWPTLAWTHLRNLRSIYFNARGKHSPCDLGVWLACASGTWNTCTKGRASPYNRCTCLPHAVHSHPDASATTHGHSCLQLR